MDIVHQLYCFFHIQTQIWQYYYRNYYRNQVMLELRERTLLRNEFLYRLITVLYEDKTSKHCIPVFGNPDPGWVLLIHYWKIFTLINKFEKEGYRCTYSEFFDLVTTTPFEKKPRENENKNKLDLLLNAVLCTWRKWIQRCKECTGLITK